MPAKYKQVFGPDNKPRMIARPRYQKLCGVIIQWLMDNKKHVPEADQHHIFQGMIHLQPYQCIGIAAYDSRGNLVCLNLDGKYIDDVRVGDSFISQTGLLQTVEPGDMLPQLDKQGKPMEGEDLPPTPKLEVQ